MLKHSNGTLGDTNSIVFRKVPENRKIRIQISYTIYAHEDTDVPPESGKPRFSCSIPAFNLVFSATSLDQARSRGRAMLDAFIEYWLKRKGYHHFVAVLQACGFKPEKPGNAGGWMTIKRLKERSFDRESALISTARLRNLSYRKVMEEQREYSSEEV